MSFVECAPLGDVSFFFWVPGSTHPDLLASQDQSPDDPWRILERRRSPTPPILAGRELRRPFDVGKHIPMDIALGSHAIKVSKTLAGRNRSIRRKIE